MKMRTLLTGLLLFSLGTGFAQSISLDSCISWAKVNYPAIQQNEIYVLQQEQNEKALRENWMPKIGFQAQAVYNTEVVQFNFPGMNIHFPHDTYMGVINVEQTVIDGGTTKAQKTIEGINTELSIQQNEVDLFR